MRSYVYQWCRSDVAKLRYPGYTLHSGRVAQLVARLPCKQKVTGSNPVSSNFFLAHKILEILLRHDQETL